MKKNVISILLVCLLLALAACGHAQTPAEASAPPAEEDWQNPVMNFVGLYGAEHGSMMVEAEGEADARITVSWASSAHSMPKRCRSNTTTA